MIADPLFEPGVNETEICVSPGVATKDVGAAGVVNGVAVTDVDAIESPIAFTAFK